MNWDDVAAGIEQARGVINMSNAHVGSMARLCVGQLRAAWHRDKLDRYTLRALKDELRSYNPHTNTWRD